MNTGALMTALGTVLTAGITVLVGWFVKRTDRAAKLTQANMADQEYILKLVGALRDDYWALIDWAYVARSKFSRLRSMISNDIHAELDNLDMLPSPSHRELENRKLPHSPISDE